MLYRKLRVSKCNNLKLFFANSWVLIFTSGKVFQWIIQKQWDKNHIIENGRPKAR